MAIPTPIVEIAFNDSPYVNNPTWTDVTTYVRSINISRGRTDDFADFDTGTASVVLSNLSRLFDPFYTAGTYYGQLLPRRQIRIRATSGATTYDIFRGFVTGWPVTYTDAGKDSTVTLQCFDALGLLASEQVSEDNYQTAILSISPRAYWKCNETTETTTLVDQIGGLNLAKVAGLPFQPTQTLLQGCTGSAAAMIEYRTAGATVGTPTGLVFSFVGKPTVASDTGNFVSYECGQMAFQVSIGVANGSALIQYIYGVTIYELTIPAGSFNPTIPHHYLFIASTSPTKLLIDGVAPTQTFVASAYPASGVVERATIENMEVQEFFVKHATTTTPVYDAEEFNALATGFNFRANTYDRNQYLLLQTPFIRYDYSTNYVQVPYITSPNGVRVLRIENTGALLPQLKTNADTEGGEMFAKKDGRILFTDRQYNTPAPNRQTFRRHSLTLEAPPSNMAPNYNSTTTPTPSATPSPSTTPPALTPTITSLQSTPPLPRPSAKWRTQSTPISQPKPTHQAWQTSNSASAPHSNHASVQSKSVSPTRPPTGQRSSASNYSNASNSYAHQASETTSSYCYSLTQSVTQ